MDPLTALIIAMWIAGRLTKNVYQDSVFKARGEDPPSFRREQERWRAKQARAGTRSADTPARRFWANAWQDAVESADERRARAAEKARERRRAKWTDADRAKAEDDAHAINERLIDEPPGHEPPGQEAPKPDRIDDTPPASPDRGERMVQCADCGNDVRATDTSWINVDGATLPVCPPCRLKRAEPAKQEFPDAPECPPTAYDDGTHKPAPDPAVGEDAEVIQFADWQRPAANTTTEVQPVTAEITGLRSAIQFCEKSAAAADENVTQTEMANAGLQAGGTYGAAITHAQVGMEALTDGGAHFRTAAQIFRRHLTIAEQYEANKGAGSREFVTNK
jgi:hypothetical protein